MPPRVFEYRPGWIGFIEGECSQAEYNNNATNDIIQIMKEVMYPFDNFQINYYYHLGFNRFEFAVTRLIEQEKLQNRNFQRPAFLRPILAYFYNRQLIIQMTYIPKLYPGQEISIPLQKSPGIEIQIDTMHFLPTQQDRQGNRNTLGLVVILEPFSRYMWIYPYGTIDVRDERRRENIGAGAAFEAFKNAFQSNGPDSQQFYNYLRTKIKRIVTDKGSEFQGVFLQRYKEVFPNATFYNATPKAQTFGRPTNTGPVEIAIGSLRRVLRDYEVAIQEKFFDGKIRGDIMKNLRQVAYAYNNTRQLSTLRTKDRHEFDAGKKRRKLYSPNEVAQLSMNNDNSIRELVDYMDLKRTEKIDKYQEKVGKYEVDGNDPFRNAFVRLYYPPPPLSKLVRYRVSFELYEVQRVYPANNSMVAQLRNEETGEILRDIGLKRLVLVKKPDPSPQAIERGLRRALREQLGNQQAVERANNRRDIIRDNDAVNNAVMGQAAGRNLPPPPGLPPRGRGPPPAGGPVLPPRRGARDRQQNQMLQGYDVAQNARGGNRRGRG